MKRYQKAVILLLVFLWIFILSSCRNTSNYQDSDSSPSAQSNTTNDSTPLLSTTEDDTSSLSTSDTKTEDIDSADFSDDSNPLLEIDLLQTYGEISRPYTGKLSNTGLKIVDNSHLFVWNSGVKPELEFNRVTIQTEVLNIRNTPNTSGEIIGLATLGQGYIVSARKTDDQGSLWYQIELDDSTGWIAADYCYIVDKKGHYYSKRIPYDLINSGYLIIDGAITVTSLDTSTNYTTLTQSTNNYDEYVYNKLIVTQSFYLSDYLYDGHQLYINQMKSSYLEDFMMVDDIEFVHKGELVLYDEYMTIADSISDDFYSLDFSHNFYGYLDVSSILHVYTRDGTHVLDTLSPNSNFKIYDDGLFISRSDGTYYLDLSTFTKDEPDVRSYFLISEPAIAYTYTKGTFWLLTSDNILYAINENHRLALENVINCLLCTDGAYLVEDLMLKSLTMTTSIDKTYLSEVNVDYFNKLDNFYADAYNVYLAISDIDNMNSILSLDRYNTNLYDPIYEDKEWMFFHYTNRSYEYGSAPVVAYNKASNEASILDYEARSYAVYPIENRLYFMFESYDYSRTYEFLANGELKLLYEDIGMVTYFNPNEPVSYIVNDGYNLYYKDISNQVLKTIGIERFICNYDGISLYLAVDKGIQIYNYGGTKSLEENLTPLININGSNVCTYGFPYGLSDHYFYYLDNRGLLHVLDADTGKVTPLFESVGIISLGDSYLYTYDTQMQLYALVNGSSVPISTDSPLKILDDGQYLNGSSKDNYYTYVKDNIAYVIDLNTNQLIYQDEIYNDYDDYHPFITLWNEKYYFTLRFLSEDQLAYSYKLIEN